MNKLAHSLFATVLLTAVAACNPQSDDTLEKTLAQRMTDDRTGACVERNLFSWLGAGRPIFGAEAANQRYRARR
jgi:hypothetical protein